MVLLLSVGSVGKASPAPDHARRHVCPLLAEGLSRLLLGLDLLGLGSSAFADRFDLDLARLHLFRDFALEIDGQQTVDKTGTHDPDVVGQFEATLERTACDAAMQILDVIAVRLLPRRQ